MARYIVKIASNGQTASLLVVLSPSQLCSALLDTIQTRLPTVASKLGLGTTEGLHISLHLDSEDGPLIDTKNLLSDVLPNATETVFAVIAVSLVASPVLHIMAVHETRLTRSQIPQSQPDGTKLQPQPSGQAEKQLRLRVVTPELAHEHTDADSIDLTSRPLTLSTTLSELRSAVAQHLSIPVGDEQLQELDCNCSAARQIDANATLSERGAGDSDALHTLVVVYEDNKVAVISTQEPKLTSIQRAAREQLQDKATGKLLCAIGGLEDPETRGGSDKQYLKLPVMAVCSCHSHRRQKEDGNDAESDAAIDDRSLTLDLHTAECPIHITVHNKDVTIAAAGLHDCAVDGVLTIYAIQRGHSTSDRHRPGKSTELFRSS